MIRQSIFNIFFCCALLICGFSSHATATLNTTLNTTARSSIQSELFARVLELEEQLRELNGRLQLSERSHINLAKKVDELYKKVGRLAIIKKTPSKQLSATILSRSISLIKRGKNTEAIKSLKTYLQETKTQNKRPKNEGEIYYWLAKAYLNKKSPDKAAHYFAKSYRHCSNVRSKDILVELIETLAFSKKYKQVCPLISKLDTKYLNSLTAKKQTSLEVLKTTHCQKKR